MKRILAATFFACLAVSSMAEAQGIRITVAPPAMRVEVRPAAPSVRHVWVPGFWRWGGGRHVWVAGRYAVPPATGRVWVDARWANEGGQWVYYEGRWASSAGVAVVPPTPPPRVVVQPAPAPVVVHQAPPPVVVVQPAPAPVIVHDRGPGWQGKGKGWKGKGKGGWHGKGKGRWK
jgi:hypothetical protein